MHHCGQKWHNGSARPCNTAQHPCAQRWAYKLADMGLLTRGCLQLSLVLRCAALCPFATTTPSQPAVLVHLVLSFTAATCLQQRR